jgi:hypothetical protein
MNKTFILSANNSDFNEFLIAENEFFNLILEMMRIKMKFSL